MPVDAAHGADRPRISVVIPHFNDLAGLDRCLAALERQTLAEPFEVVVADNGSAVGSEAVRDAIRGRARLVVVDERGAGPARNGGVAASRGTILAFTDSDCVPAPGWLAAGVAALGRYDFVGGHVSVLVGDRAAMTPVEAFESVFAFNFRDYIERKGFTGSGNLFVSRTVFDRVGGFRAAVSEDVDWSHRARDLGFRLGYAEAAEVAHPARTDWAELMAKWRRVQREMWTLARTRRFGRLAWTARTAAMPLSALAHTPRVLFSPALPDAHARTGALRVLWRLRLWRFGDGLARLLGRG